MGCDYYTKRGIHFSDGDESVGCLCTFPHNDGESLTKRRIRSLAYLGAAVALDHQGELEHSYLPSCLPDWIRRDIDKALGIK